MISTAVLMFSFAAATPATERIEVGHAPWDKLPRLPAVERDLRYDLLVGQMERILETGECKLAGQKANKFNVTVPYAIILDSRGKAQRVLVSDTGCAPLENMVGEIVYGLSDLGDFQSSEAQPGKWYADEISLILE